MSTTSKNKKRVIFFSLIFTVALIAGGLHADEDDEHNEHGYRRTSRTTRLKELASPAPSPIYKAECAACHMLYPPGLLPERSWKKMMSDLENHFGDNAGLDPATAAEIQSYLIKNSADRSGNRRSMKFMRSVGTNETPLRFSDSVYFNRKHNEIATSVYKRKSIGSKANCLACHSGAERGDFEEHDVRIPK